ncbi:MAG: glycoside hydrolase family 13 [Chloroflexales bacterium]|nr:glycoside hydrolase family 13 [Chloroflexales bacterium]
MVMREIVPAQPDKVRVTFSVPASLWADTISLAGDFNEWDPERTPLRKNEEAWSVSLLLERGHTYAYSYLVDHSEWMPDSNADGYTVGDDGSSRSLIVALPPLPAQ